MGQTSPCQSDWKNVNPIQVGFFWAGHEWRRGCLFSPLPKICHTDPTMIKLGAVIPYVKKIQKMYKSRDTSLEFC